MPQQMNQEQVKNLLKYVDAALDETVKRNVFTQLGHECFRCNHLNRWLQEFNGDVQLFLDRINVQHQSVYWESLVFSADKSRLTLTGKEVAECACPFAGHRAPLLVYRNESLRLASIKAVKTLFLCIEFTFQLVVTPSITP